MNDLEKELKMINRFIKMNYIRKPIKVEVIQWQYDNDKDVIDFIRGSHGDRPFIKAYNISYYNHCGAIDRIKLTLAQHEVYVQRGFYLVKADCFFDVVTPMRFEREYEINKIK
jgi:hypothetical protein